MHINADTFSRSDSGDNVHAGTATTTNTKLNWSRHHNKTLLWSKHFLTSPCFYIWSLRFLQTDIKNEGKYNGCNTMLSGYFVSSWLLSLCTMKVFPEVNVTLRDIVCFTDVFLWMKNHIKKTDRIWLWIFLLKATKHKTYCDYWMAGTLQIMNGIKDVKHFQAFILLPSKMSNGRVYFNNPKSYVIFYCIIASCT